MRSARSPSNAIMSLSCSGVLGLQYSCWVTAHIISSMLRQSKSGIVSERTVSSLSKAPAFLFCKYYRLNSSSLYLFLRSCCFSNAPNRLDTAGLSSGFFSSPCISSMTLFILCRFRLYASFIIIVKIRFCRFLL